MNHHQLAEHPHAVMFHHFHDERHAKGQGSISADQFSDMLDWLDRRYKLLGADEYQAKVRNGSLAAREICLTFDDALLCQAEIAAPILNQKGIQAFFFVYSSPFSGTPDFLEIYRYFRNTQFATVDAFYAEFFNTARDMLGADYGAAESAFDGESYLAAYPFYTLGDKWFRYLRDEVLGKSPYEQIMHTMMRTHGFDAGEAIDRLWMNTDHLRALNSAGHQIGLHSYTHPTTMHLLDRNAQREEYASNRDHLIEVLGAPPCSMSHPCGQYNADTLEILAEMGVDLGFRSNNSVKEIRSPLEVPREDHANLMKAMLQ